MTISLFHWFLIFLGVHLHELLEGSDVHLPEPVVPTRVIAVVFHIYLHQGGYVLVLDWFVILPVSLSMSRIT